MARYVNTFHQVQKLLSVECYRRMIRLVNFKDWEGSDRGLFKVVSRHSHTGTDEKRKEPQSA
jgi:hypothetical protein